MRLVNYSGYDTGDLYRFVRKGCVSMGVPSWRMRELVVVVMSAPQRSRGCATIGGANVVLAIAPPSYDRSRDGTGLRRRFSRLLYHELSHDANMEHRQMGERQLYSLGPTLGWAEGMPLRYRGRAPNQLRALRGLPDRRPPRTSSGYQHRRPGEPSSLTRRRT